MTELQKTALQKRLADIITEAGHEAYIMPFEVTTRNEMLECLNEWYSKSTNTQHVIFISHGIQIGDEWTGIGSDYTPDEMIEWDTLTQVATQRC